MQAPSCPRLLFTEVIYKVPPFTHSSKTHWDLPHSRSNSTVPVGPLTPKLGAFSGLPPEAPEASLLLEAEGSWYPHD